MYQVRVSVRTLVESMLATGDIGGQMLFMSVERALEGSRVHRLHQAMRMEEDSSYQKEVYLKDDFRYEELTVTVDGRADGILPGKYIEEIKSTYRNLKDMDEDYNELHWAQVKFYGYIYMVRENLSSIDLKLTYYRIDTDEFLSFDRSYTLEELREFTQKTIDLYGRLQMLNIRWQEYRDRSIKELEFPFTSYRPGQREMAVSVYNTIREEKRILIQAPTGIGKTISTLFPAVKALREKKTDRIFYLTPKSTGKEIGETSVGIMRSHGTKLRSITLTSKEKICFMEEVRCEADYCPFAKGYYDRVMEAVIDILENEDSLSREVIETYARKHTICPFEFSLDLSYYADIIIGDYNYAFDPRVYLKRFFDDKNAAHTFLIDEAHNLLDRGREMFSSEITLSSYIRVSNDLRVEEPKIAKASDGVGGTLLTMGDNLPENGRMSSPVFNEYLYENVLKFTTTVSSYLSDEQRIKEREDFKQGFKEEWDHLMDTFFNSLSFIRIAELYNEGHISYIEAKDNEIRYRLFCIDPAESLRSTYHRADSIVYFSATLSPMDYYRNIYGVDTEDYHMLLPSPFDKEKLKVFVDTEVNTRFKYRDMSIGRIVENLNRMASSRKGNYIAFFPSYKYMDTVYREFQEEYGDRYIVRRQEPGLKETERQEVIRSFEEVHEESMVYFMVLGGVFAEGIDLKGDRLIGTALIGLGYPTFDFERELIQNYFQDKTGEGFNYAYTYPGMAKVTQAGGRVIRTEEDRGMIFLMDDRYRNLNIRRLLPESWFPLLNKERLEESGLPDVKEVVDMDIAENLGEILGDSEV